MCLPLSDDPNTFLSSTTNALQRSPSGPGSSGVSDHIFQAHVAGWCLVAAQRGSVGRQWGREQDHHKSQYLLHCSERRKLLDFGHPAVDLDLTGLSCCSGCMLCKPRLLSAFKEKTTLDLLSDT